MIFRNKTNILVSLDKDARNFIDAAGLNTDSNLSVSGLYTAAEARMAIHLLVKGMKAIGTWDLCKAIYVFVGGTATTHKFNLKDPRDLDAAYRLSYSGTTSHNALGMATDGSTGFANTMIVGSDLNTLKTAYCAYFGAGTSSAGNALGFRDTNSLAQDVGYFFSFNSGAGFGAIISSYGSWQDIPLLSSESACIIYSKLNSAVTSFKNGSKMSTVGATTNNPLSTSKFYLGAIYNTTSTLFGGSRNFRFFSLFNENITDQQAIQQSNLVEVFNASLNRSAFTR